MTNTQEFAPLSIAVALPAYRRALVERMLQRLLQENGEMSADWYVSHAAEADVTLRLPPDEGADPSASLLAELRRPDGGRETLTIEWPWRPGALLAALQRIARLLRSGAAGSADARDALAWQWLRRWSELALEARGRLLELRMGGQVVALMDARLGYWYAANQVLPDAAQFVTALARDSYSIELGQATPPPLLRPVSIKPLLWQLGVRSGHYGALPALRQRGGLRLKGWPYLAAGGPKAYAELIQKLRGGFNTAASLRDSGLAAAGLVDGFLNACLVCDFFHGETAEPAASAPAPVPVPAGVFAGAQMRPGNEQAVIASIRRSLHAGTP
ncbi:hypothetical protein [Tahibacter harae]|uniref:Uncharacterized protein n=1 Tax=Tahibacter harae TaxID=2963937 RepID=A0ABT1QQU4_9GAMM|nr:hypothetical protein [Tahibacter harae]MCQ4164659.1 hypothetical protein [Tahibacter harae]